MGGPEVSQMKPDYWNAHLAWSYQINYLLNFKCEFDQGIICVAPNSQNALLCISRKTASNIKHQGCLCLCSVQPLTKVSTHQILWYFLLSFSVFSFFILFTIHSWSKVHYPSIQQSNKAGHTPSPLCPFLIQFLSRTTHFRVQLHQAWLVLQCTGGNWGANMARSTASNRPPNVRMNFGRPLSGSRTV